MVQEPTDGDYGGVVDLGGGGHRLFRELRDGAVHKTEAFRFTTEKHGEANRGGPVPANKAGVQGEDPAPNAPGKRSGQVGCQGHHRSGVKRVVARARMARFRVLYIRLLNTNLSENLNG